MTNGSNSPVTTTELSGNTISTQVQPWEDGLRTNPDKNEFEWWYFDFSFSDGSTAVIFFSTKSFLNPAGNPDPEVNLVITDPHGNKISVSDNPGKENFTSSTSNLDIKLGNSFVKGDLYGCQLHYWGNIRLDKIKTQWYWGRARIDDYTLIFAQMLTAPKYGSKEIPVFYLAKGNRILSGNNYKFTFTPAQWKRHSGGRQCGEQIEICTKSYEYIQADTFLRIGDFP